MNKASPQLDAMPPRKRQDGPIAAPSTSNTKSVTQVAIIRVGIDTATDS